MRALLAELDASYANRNQGSPALALAPIIGLGAPKVLQIACEVEDCSPIPRARCLVAIDSRKANWFVVALWERDSGTTRFGNDTPLVDDLNVGRCEAPNLPAWLRVTAGRLGVTWAKPSIRTNQHGAKQDLVAAWLDVTRPPTISR